MARDKLSVVVATKDRPASLAALLTSLVVQNCNPFELVVGLNGQRNWSDQCEKLCAVLQHVGISVVLIDCRTFSYSETHAALLRRAQHEFVCRVDDDQVLTYSYLSTLQAALRDDLSLSAVGGIVLHPEEHRSKYSPREFTRLLRKLSVAPCLHTALQLRRHPTNTIRRVPDLYSTFMARKAHINAVGGIAICYRKCGYREETDLTLRLSMAGYGVAVVPAAVAWHIRANEGGERRSTSRWKLARQENDRIFRRRFRIWQAVATNRELLQRTFRKRNP